MTMSILTLCLIFVDYYSFVHSSDMQYFTEVENLFCSKTPSTSPASHTEKILSDIPVIPPSESDSGCCGDCSDDVKHCDITDSCCVEILETLSPGNGSDVRMTCDYTQLRPYKKFGYPNWEWSTQMFRECPKVYKNSINVISKCEKSENYNDIYTKIPVTDARTMYIYKNRYCAYCHNVTEDDLHYWNAELQCVRGILKPRSISSLVTEVLATENCNLIYFKPASLGYEGPFYDCNMVISKCNVSGQWTEYDPVIEAGCLAYSTIFDFKYRNVFCYLCNTNDTYGPVNCSSSPDSNVFADFMALLKFRQEVSTVNYINITDKCSVDQIYDPLKKLCRDIECLFPKTVENGRCVNIVEELKGVTYGLYLKLTPSEHTHISSCSNNFDFANNVKEVIISWLSIQVYSYLVSVYVYAKGNASSWEKIDGSNHTMEYFIVYIEVVFEISISSDVIDYMLAIRDEFIDTGNCTQNGTNVKYKVEIYVYDVIDVHISDPFLGKHELKVSQKGFESYYPKTILSVIHACPFVRINSQEYNISRHSNSIFIEEINATVNGKEVLIEALTNGEVFSVCMCTDVFEKLLEPFAGFEKQLKRPNKCEITTVSTNAILSLVCTIISILFSVVTVIIYLRFKELKTQPGINNIVLCFTLIIAQSVFQFGTGQSCNVSKVSCQILGIMVHFSWLFLIFWMNACCIHMFRVFKLRRTRMVSFNTTKTTVIYLLYSSSASLILILINVIITLNKSKGENVGYGGSMCYISDEDMVAYVFALPVALVILINIILFLTVIIQMANSHAVQNSTKENNQSNLFQIYGKLSTLTGGTWVFGFLNFFLNVAALDYIFIILNASLGLFLFFAFVANKRTLHFLRNGEHSQSGATRNTKT